ncbi:MAG: hypothetical protein SGPRY_006344, partial [Prymnesium sp.]
SHHSIIDMCAAPGSKTTQIVDAMGRSTPSSCPPPSVRTGLVVANDADPIRAYTLVKRCSKALGAAKAGVVVTCHKAQRFPRLCGRGREGGEGGGGAGEEGESQEVGDGDGEYDRVICDVPCTGDGTVRKNPEVFARWEPELAFRMHELQLQIAMRAVSLLKPGGRMVYSTCSLNPIENEAVVAEILRRCGGVVRVCDVNEEAKKVVGECARGMDSWRVMDGGLASYATFEAALESCGSSVGERRRYCRSMWPPSEGETLTAASLRRCVRLFPHLSNTGGFFVAVLSKSGPLPGPVPRWPHAAQHTPHERPAMPSATRHRYVPIPKALSKELAAAFLDCRDGAKHLQKHLFMRSTTGRRIVFMSQKCGEHCRNTRVQVDRCRLILDLGALFQ